MCFLFVIYKFWYKVLYKYTNQLKKVCEIWCNINDLIAYVINKNDVPINSKRLLKNKKKLKIIYYYHNLLCTPLKLYISL